MTASPSPSPRNPLGRAYARYVAAVFAHPKLAALLLCLACVPGIVLDAQFFSNVRTGLEDLLPKSAPSVRAIDALHKRLGGRAHITVIAQSDDPLANRKFIDELGARLEASHPKEARTIQVRVDVERRWMMDHGALLMPQADFDRLIDKVTKAIHDAKAKAKSLDLGLDDDEPAAPNPAWKDIDDEIHTATGKYDRFPNGYFETSDGKTVVLMVWLEGSEVEIDPAEHLRGAIQKEVDAIRGKYAPSMVVAYNGEVPNLIEEHAAILADLSFSSILVFLLVGLLIVIYFRSMRGVIAVVAGLTPGLIATFALGRLMVGSLNSNSAFLGSIIGGNGINYPLIFLAYYRARPAGSTMSEAIYEAAVQATPGTLGAAATASAAYGGLSASTFRGFSEFGLIGGVGMLATWVLTFITMPIAIANIDPPRHETGISSLSTRIDAFFGLPRIPLLTALAFLALASLGAGMGLLRASESGYFEMNIQTMRNRESLRSGSASWDKRMNDVFGVWLNPVVALAATPADRLEVASRLRKALTTGEPALAERVETIDDYAPLAADQQKRIDRLQALAPDVRRIPEKDVPPSARPFVRSWFADENLRPIQAADVPVSLKQNFTEIDGSTDRTVLLFPSLKLDYNDATWLMRFEDRVNTVELPPGTVVGGSFLFMAEIIHLIQHEATHIVFVVCVLVALALIPVFLRRPLRIVASVGTVAIVAVFSQAIMLALGVRVNMMNFAAVPITIGVGADYVVNLFGAMDGLGVDIRRACARMGGAILLCSLTTVVGYLSLVFAESGALRTFGWACVLGEVMAVTTVLLVLPSLSPQVAAEPEKREALV